MRKFLFLTTLTVVFATFGLSAQNIALWTEALPGCRVPLDISNLPEKIFAQKTEEIAIPSGKVEIDEANPLKDTIHKIASMTVTGLVWSNKASERRVLMGDIVMREGQAIPAYVFDDGREYVLTQIDKASLRFQIKDPTGENPLVFEVPFGLKNPLKNESSFSGNKNANK